MSNVWVKNGINLFLQSLQTYIMESLHYAPHSYLSSKTEALATSFFLTS